MKQMKSIIKETYLWHVKSWSFLLMILSPFVLLLSVGVISSMGINLSSRFNQAPLALVTQDRSIKEVLKDSSSVTLKYEDEAGAKKALKSDKIKGYVLLGTINHQIYATYYGENGMSPMMKVNLLQKLQLMQGKLNLAQAGLSSSQAAILDRQVNFTESIDHDKANNEFVKFIIFYALNFVIYMISLLYTSLIAQEAAYERGTKITDIIFSSVKASHYFYGRLIGFFAIIVTHIAIYAFGSFLFYRLSFLFPVFYRYQSFINKSVGAFPIETIIFMVLGLLNYIIISALLVSMVSRVEDANKAIRPVLSIIMIGFFGVMILGQLGKNMILTIGSYIPFISTFFMPVRLINGEATSMEAWISITILFLFTSVLLAAIGKVYCVLVCQDDNISFWKSLRKFMPIFSQHEQKPK